jgi:hypothetical protein
MKHTHIYCTGPYPAFNLNFKHSSYISGAFGCNDKTRWNETIPQIRLFGFGSRVETELSQCCPLLSLKIGGTRENARGRPCPVLADPQPNAPFYSLRGGTSFGNSFFKSDGAF